MPSVNDGRIASPEEHFSKLSPIVMPQQDNSPLALSQKPGNWELHPTMFGRTHRTSLSKNRGRSLRGRLQSHSDISRTSADESHTCWPGSSLCFAGASVS